MLASSSSTKTLVPLCTLRSHDAAVTAVAWVTVRKDSEDGESSVDPLSRSSTENVLVSGDTRGMLKVWDMRTRRHIYSTCAHSSDVLSIDRFPLGGKVISHGRDGAIKCWRLATTNAGTELRLLRTILCRSYTFCKARLGHSIGCGSSNDYCRPGSAPVYLATPTFDPKQVDIFEVATARRVLRVRPKCTFKSGMCLSLSIFAMAVGGDADTSSCYRRWMLAMGFESGHVAFFALDGISRDPKDEDEDGEGGDASAIATHDVAPIIYVQLSKKPILCLEIDSTGAFGACAGAASEMIFFRIDWDERVCVPRTTVSTPSKPGFNHVALRPDEKICAFGGWDNRIRIFQWRRRRLPKPLAVLEAHEAAISAVAFSSDCTRMAASSRDKNITVWGIYPPKKTGTSKAGCS